MVPMSPHVDVAIIGAGLSGTLTAIQLAHHAPELRVALIERSGKAGMGLAYSTPDATHLLNVRADRMSAIPADPDGFVRWLANQPRDAVWRVETDAGVFVSRQAYGRYLREMLDSAEAASGGRLRLIEDAVSGIERNAKGFSLTLGAGALNARSVVLAMGNLAAPFALPDGGQAINPWMAGAFDDLDPDAPVAVIGTGLTMIDVLTSLRRRGHRGRITAISRRGLMPHAHAPLAALPPPELTGALTGPLSQRLKRLRIAARTHGWRETVDALRPATQSLWQAMSVQEKQRFLRHARPWWDVHRHRIAAPAAAMVENEIAAGTLEVLAGRISGMGAGALTITKRGGGECHVPAARIFDATGFGPLARSGDPLVAHLLRSGLAVSDAAGLGLAADTCLQVRGQDGPAPGLYAIGPMVRGEYWECTAVPDIRLQAEALARHLAVQLDPVQRDQA
ncbi:MAG: FAD/NAD(P)-binding protein [Caulobacterales bacterium]|uniref:FAD/NAD(P)-binding protein n=1 Tax=Glycocaulis sp. TaxID=1969725 RepID=UPI003FA07F0E